MEGIDVARYFLVWHLDLAVGCTVGLSDVIVSVDVNSLFKSPHCVRLYCRLGSSVLFIFIFFIYLFYFFASKVLSSKGLNIGKN